MSILRNWRIFLMGSWSLFSCPKGREFGTTDALAKEGVNRLLLKVNHVAVFDL